MILISAFFFVLENTAKKTKSLNVRKCTSFPFSLKAVYMGEDCDFRGMLGTCGIQTFGKLLTSCCNQQKIYIYLSLLSIL